MLYLWILIKGQFGNIQIVLFKYSKVLRQDYFCFKIQLNKLNMLEKNIDIETIVEITGLSKDEIENYKTNEENVKIKFQNKKHKFYFKHIG